MLLWQVLFVCRPFPFALENNHIVNVDQVFCGIIKTGPNNVNLNCSFHQRDTESYKRELGNAILKASQVIPEGLLVFFPSYFVMEQCLLSWRAKVPPGESLSLFDQLTSVKPIVIEPRAKGGELKNVILLICFCSYRDRS